MGLNCSIVLYLCNIIYTIMIMNVIITENDSHPHSCGCKFWNLKTGPLPSVALMAPTFFSQLHYLRTCIAKSFVNYNRAPQFLWYNCYYWVDLWTSIQQLLRWRCGVVLCFSCIFGGCLAVSDANWQYHVVSPTSFLFLIHLFHAHSNFVVFWHSGGKEGVLVVWQLDTGKRKFLPRIGSPLLYFTSSLDPSLSSVRFF